MKLIPSPEYEKKLGILYYQTKTKGIGGKIRLSYKDFVVKEVNVLNTYAGRGKYAYYELTKKGIDTLTALMMVSKRLKIPMKHIGYAGLKDAKALTYQLISIPSKYKIPKHININNHIMLEFLGQGNFPLRKGMLKGNIFKLFIRNVSEIGVEDQLSNILYEINENGGLYPFYGHQRFGTTRSNTHIVGKLLVKHKWEEAVVEIVGHPHPRENPRVCEARRIFEKTGEAKEALKLFPRKYVYERIILKHLIRKPENYFYALRKLPKFIIQFYIEAYQSFIFNKYVSKRMELDISPSTAVKGDMIVRNSEFTIVRARVKIDPLREKILLPLIGYKTLKLDESLKEVLEEENVSTKEFLVKELNVGVEGGFRKTPMIIKNLDYIVFGRNVFFSFFLNKGYYATIFLREIMKNENVF